MAACPEPVLPLTTPAEPSVPPEIGIERHYSPAQIAKALNLSDTKVRRMFQDEPGVAKIGEPSRRLGRKLKRRYYTLRIPESIALKVLARMRNR